MKWYASEGEQARQLAPNWIGEDSTLIIGLSPIKDILVDAIEDWLKEN